MNIIGQILVFLMFFSIALIVSYVLLDMIVGEDKKASYVIGIASILDLIFTLSFVVVH